LLQQPLALALIAFVGSVFAPAAAAGRIFARDGFLLRPAPRVFCLRPSTSEELRERQGGSRA
jgi:hypothetical protein